jgi:hypothetical protein
MKMCKDFAPNFGDKRTGCCITTHCLTLPFSPGNFFYQKQHDCRPPPTLLTLLGSLRLKGCHFDTTEVIEAESQAVLNTLTEHNFQDAFKKWQKRWERCICAEGDYECDGGQ